MEYHEEVVARLLTSIAWVPVEAPGAVWAVTTLESEESAVIDANAPLRLFSEVKSFSSVVVCPLMVVRSFSWPWSFDSCDCHCVSGASAAWTAAFTASVTSIPSELEPVATSNSELRSMPSVDEDVVPESKDAKLDDERPTELIAPTPWRE